MTEANIDRVWDIIEDVGVCMLTTQFGGGLRARPLEPRPDRNAGLIFFVTDSHSAKEGEIQAKPDVGMTFINLSEKAYLFCGRLAGPDFCLIFAPCGYDEPEIVPSESPSICLRMIRGGLVAQEENEEVRNLDAPQGRKADPWQIKRRCSPFLF